MKTRLLVLTFISLWIACWGEIASGLPQSFHLNSGAILPDQPIPRSYTYDGGNQIPPLNWFGQPSGTQQFVLVAWDSDAPKNANGSPLIHWMVYAIPEGTSDITNALLEGAPEALNSFGYRGWNGPVPQVGAPAHHYIFTLYALDSILYYPLNATSFDVLRLIQGHVLAEASLMGTYHR